MLTQTSLALKNNKTAAVAHSTDTHTVWEILVFSLSLFCRRPSSLTKICFHFSVNGRTWLSLDVWERMRDFCMWQTMRELFECVWERITALSVCECLNCSSCCWFPGIRAMFFVLLFVRFFSMLIPIPSPAHTQSHLSHGSCSWTGSRRQKVIWLFHLFLWFSLSFFLPGLHSLFAWNICSSFCYFFCFILLFFAVFCYRHSATPIETHLFLTPLWSAFPQSATDRTFFSLWVFFQFACKLKKNNFLELYSCVSTLEKIEYGVGILYLCMYRKLIDIECIQLKSNIRTFLIYDHLVWPQKFMWSTGHIPFIIAASWVFFLLLDRKPFYGL